MQLQQADGAPDMGQPDEALKQKAGDKNESGDPAQQAIPQGFGAGDKSGHFGANPEKSGHPKTQESEPRQSQSFGKALGGEGNPNHDELGRFSSVFSSVRTDDERRGSTFSRTKLLPEHVGELAELKADLILHTRPVVLPVRQGNEARKGAFEAAKKVAVKMRDQGLAIKNQESGALIELSVRGLKHAKTMSGDIRSALMMYKLPMALSRAVYLKTETPDVRKESNQNIVAYHKFVVPIEHDGALALSVMHIEEDKRGHFYYDASVTPEIERLDGTSGASIAERIGDRETGLRQACINHIKAALNVKADLSEIHTFFRKSFLPPTNKPAKKLLESPSGAVPAAARLGVDHGDEVFYAHPAHGLASGKVIAHGKDGFTVAHESGPLGIPWEDYHGHKSRKERHYTPVEQGEDGMIAEESGSGRRVYLRGELPSEEFNQQKEK